MCKGTLSAKKQLGRGSCHGADKYFETLIIDMSAKGKDERLVAVPVAYEFCAMREPFSGIKRCDIYAVGNYVSFFRRGEAGDLG